MASRPNPTTMKNRSGRLSAFARGTSDAQAHYNTEAPKHDQLQRRSDTPFAPAAADVPIPSREEVADDARVPIPRVSRVLSPAKALPLSPHHPNELARRNQYGTSPELGAPWPTQERYRRDVFEGSVLGDDFMQSQSGLTTPQNEPEEAYVDYGDNRPDEQDENRVTRYSRNLAPRNAPIFEVNNRGYMRVKNGSGRQSPSNVKDGFQDGGDRVSRDQQHNDRYRQSSPGGRPKNIPIREVKIHRSRGSIKDHQAAKQAPRSPSPSVDRRPWESRHDDRTGATSMVIELDDDDSQAGQDALQETPKAKQNNQITQKNLMESSMPPIINLNRHVPTKKRHRASPDYDDQVLSSMDYAQLQSEPFDKDPAREAMANGHGSTADPLAKKLEQLRHQSEREQRTFFSSLTMNEWEESGDWFVDQFSGYMNKLKEARRSKRRMIHSFEAEASKHEEAVRARSDAIDHKLAKMRQDGQKVVGGKMF